eukprot:3901739-Pleurochrysis_carterae.AAC.1
MADRFLPNKTLARRLLHLLALPTRRSVRAPIPNSASQGPSLTARSSKASRTSSSSLASSTQPP